MENGKESVDLLVEKDFSLALKAARHINEYNEQRKDIDKQMTEEANLIVSKLETKAPVEHCALRRELEEGCHRHRGVASHGNLFPPNRGANAR